MPSALGYGLMGAAQGALQGAYQQWGAEQERQRTERYLAAKAAFDEKVATVQAGIDAKKDERDFEQDKELKDIEVSAADKRLQAQQEAADKRAAEANASRVKAAEIRASRPRGSGTPPAKQLFENKESGEQRWFGQDEKIPSGWFRVSARSTPPKSAPPKKEAPPPKADPNAPPVEGARKAADGMWYVQQNGKWFKVEP